MQGQGNGKRMAGWLFVTALGATGLAMTANPGVCAEGSSGQSQASGASAATPPSAGSENAEGMKIYIDPRTGAIVPKPVPGTVPMQVSPQVQQSLSTSHQGLVETPSSVPGGGVGINLQGRFQSPLIATVGPDGKARMHHLGEPHGSAAHPDK